MLLQNDMIILLILFILYNVKEQQEEGIGHAENEFTYNLDSERKGDDGR